MIEEKFKAEMIGAGVWRATRPDVKNHAGFRLSALNSLLVNCSWANLAAEFLAAKNDPSLLQVFTNLSLAQGWRGATGEMLDENALAARAEAFSLDDIPPAVALLTLGVDLQDDRAEATVVGWDRGGTAFVLDHIVIWGAFTDDLLWQEVDALLRTGWKNKRGITLRIVAAVIDAGDGDHAVSVLAFTAPRLARRVFAGKGVAGTRPAFEISKTKKQAGRLAIIGVDVIKSQILDKLSRGVGIRFSANLPPVYYEQLASERRVIKFKFGRPVRRFERIAGRAAEALDALAYAFAARASFKLSQRPAMTEQSSAQDHETETGPEPMVREIEPTREPQPYRPAPMQSSWIHNGRVRGNWFNPNG